MSLPIDVTLSATALECYLSCPRRFRHRYIDRLPAAGQDADSSEQMRRGDLFHKLVAWDGLGLDTGPILYTADDPDLGTMWRAYLTFQESLPAMWHDLTLTARCGDVRLQARLDALALDGTDGVTIFDWKTSSRPDRAKLAGSPQSMVYPYVVWNTVAIPGGATPERVSLVYWFPESPDEPLRIDCDREYLERSTEWLESAIQTIAADAAFKMTPNRATCRTCEYLAHCGVRPTDGDTPPLDEDYFVLSDADEDPATLPI